MTNVQAAATVADITAEDIIDSRDLITLRDVLKDDAGDEENVPPAYDAEDREAMLAAIAEFESAGVDDWEYGATFVRDSYFEEYARDLADDIGAIPADDRWPLYCIDWQRAARDLQQDYTAVDVNGITYWAR